MDRLNWLGGVLFGASSAYATLILMENYSLEVFCLTITSLCLGTVIGLQIAKNCDRS
jgi:hypothetical protein